MSTPEVLLILAAVAVGFFVKGVTGMGGPMLAIPVLAALVGVERAVLVMAVPALVANTWLLIENRRAASECRDLAVLLVTGTVGAVLGSWLLVELDDRLLSLTLAGLIVAYVGLFLTNPRLRVGERVSRWLSPPVGFGSGVLQGATGVSAPLIATYVHAFRLEMGAYVLTITSAFQVYGLVQIVTLAVLGRYTPARLGEAALATLPVLVALPLGMRLGRRLSRRSFELAVLAVLVVAAARLLLSALGDPV